MLYCISLDPLEDPLVLWRARLKLVKAPLMANKPDIFQLYKNFYTFVLCLTTANSKRNRSDIHQFVWLMSHILDSQIAPNIIKQ